MFIILTLLGNIYLQKLVDQKARWPQCYFKWQQQALQQVLENFRERYTGIARVYLVTINSTFLYMYRYIRRWQLVSKNSWVNKDLYTYCALFHKLNIAQHNVITDVAVLRQILMKITWIILIVRNFHAIKIEVIG